MIQHYMRQRQAGTAGAARYSVSILGAIILMIADGEGLDRPDRILPPATALASLATQWEEHIHHHAGGSG